DRFRLFVNDRIGHGREALTLRDVFVINIVGVWLLMAAVIVAARTVDPGLGAIAVYLVLVNALLHVGQGIALRCYNPGMLTAIVVFLPLGLAAWQGLGPSATPAMHALGLAVAIAVHAAIVVHVRRRLAAPAPAPA
ncbi:HXXEE domain-containing protein, partial [Nostoc sp. NIES-2111]